MSSFRFLQVSAFVGAIVLAMATPAAAQDFNVPSGDLKAALDAYIRQSGVTVVYSPRAVAGVRSKGIKGAVSSDTALSRILAGTGFTEYHTTAGDVGIVHDTTSENNAVEPLQLAQAAAPPRAAVETVTVTSSKLGGADVQSIPISITALSQEQLTATQTAGGPDLIKEVPNMTFTKTNFSGYNIQIRGIGTQAISVTTDPAVAVAFNDIPFLRNHFFEQEFYDVSQVEVLRGPQGTLYGRNATAGVVNLESAKPTDQFEAMASADLGNYHNRRFEGMINLPIVDDRVDIRVAGEWTKRDGYTENTTLNSPIDGRDLWSSRVTLGWKPVSNVQAYLVWEHFSEDDDRLRSGKQLCKTAPIFENFPGGGYGSPGNYLSQGCEDTSLYSPNAFEVPNGYSLTYFAPLNDAGAPTLDGFDAYAETTQSRNLRDIQSAIDPTYRAKNDTLELNVDYAVAPALTFTSQTGFNRDFLWSSEDYDRFDSAPGAFIPGSVTPPDPSGLHVCNSTGYPGTCQNLPEGAPCTPNGPGDSSCALAAIFCDPQLGCSDRLVLEDLSDERAWQLSQEFRLASSFGGPFNFSAGGNFLHYETEENYYVFINSLTSLAAATGAGDGFSWVPGVSDNSQCLPGGLKTINPLNAASVFGCDYIDPNPISSLNNEGHNYFLSQNPYTLNSYAGFGEAYYNVTKDLKLTAGARWTDDQKHFVDIPSELLNPGYGYPVTDTVDQQWDRWTGRFVADWTPQLDFTDQTLIYASAAHGYKAGGANPPGAFFPTVDIGTPGIVTNPIHPLTFKPEYIEAFELGTKNTLLGGGLTLNGDVFYYNYTGYQISEIVDRTAINNNYNAHVEGAEFEGNWEPLPGLKFSLAQGFESTALAGGDQGIDLMDRTAGMPGWVVVKPYITTASNCILPAYVINAIIDVGGPHNGNGRDPFYNTCNFTYGLHDDPVTGFSYAPNPTATSDGTPIPAGYPGFNPTGPGIANVATPNNGEGFDKRLGGNQLPGAPHFTTSLTAEYTTPVTADWAVTLHGDFYWQAQQWARVFEDSIDNIHGYSTTNLSLVFTNQNGWQAMAYVKNVFNVTAITGTFLNSDDTGLTTNVFLTDPRLIGIRVTKNW